MVTLLLVLLFVLPISAQFNPGADNVSTAFSNTSYYLSPFSLLTNPALQSNSQSLSVAAYYSPAPFGLNELRHIAAASDFRFKNTSFGISYSLYGFELYSENTINVSGSYQLFDHTFLGAGFNISTLRISGYGNKTIFPITLGGIFIPVKDLSVGFTIKNLNNASYSEVYNDSESEIRVGASYSYQRATLLLISIAKDSDKKPSLNLGVSQRIFQVLDIRCGFSTYPELFTSGFGFLYENYQFNYGLLYHGVLGYTHQIDMNIKFETF